MKTVQIENVQTEKAPAKRPKKGATYRRRLQRVTISRTSTCSQGAPI